MTEKGAKQPLNPPLGVANALERGLSASGPWRRGRRAAESDARTFLAGFDKLHACFFESPPKKQHIFDGDRRGVVCSLGAPDCVDREVSSIGQLGYRPI